MSKLWVDPPSGWRYGFPKIWDSVADPDLAVFLKKNGVPQKIIDLGHVRTWNVTPQDIGEVNQTDEE